MQPTKQSNKISAYETENRMKLLKPQLPIVREQGLLYCLLMSQGAGLGLLTSAEQGCIIKT
jgi:hypothetical protein